MESPGWPMSWDAPCANCGNTGAGARPHLPAPGMTQSAVARFEAGGTVPILPVLDRLARALDVDLVVHLTPRRLTGCPNRR